MSINYAGIRAFTNRDEATRCASQLKALRAQLATTRALNTADSLMLATWNLRDFGAIGKFGSKGRNDESFYYIAEIMSVFDLIAVQEVNDDLEEFDRLMGILGTSDWGCLLTDVTEGTGGNGERMAFVYNRHKVRFLNIAGEIVLPGGQLIVPPAPKKKSVDPDPSLAKDPNAGPTAEALPVEDPKKKSKVPGQQFARTPFLVSFQSGWLHLNLCTVHIYYGKASGVQFQRRVAEIQRLVNFFANRQNDENKAVEAKAVRRAEKRGDPNAAAAKPSPQDYQNYMLLGDFNVVNFADPTMEALERRGFEVPEPIRDKPASPDLPPVARPHFYDQIAVRARDERFEVTDGGTVDIYESVFRNDQLALYTDQVPAKDVSEDDDEFKAKTPDERYVKWRTWQMSDHWPLWIRIKTDFSEDYLDSIDGTPSAKRRVIDGQLVAGPA